MATCEADTPKRGRGRRLYAAPAAAGAVIAAAVALSAVLARTEVESYRETEANPMALYGMPPRGSEPRYVGSERCSQCHAEEYARWRTSHHTRSVTLPSAETIRADLELDGTHVHEGHTYRFYEKDGAYWISEEAPDGRVETHRVDYVTGFRRIQMFLTRMPDGRIQSLPLFREVDQPDHPDRRQRERGGRWFDYSEMVWRKDKAFLGPDNPDHWTHQGRNWNERCTDCHISRVKRNYRPGTDTYETEWLELTIGCEACHGPGSVHVERWTNMEGIPEGRDFVDLRGLDARRSVEACAECHAEKDEIFGSGFLPGGNFHDYFLVRLMDDDIRVYPDGRYKELNYNYMPLAQSPCYTRGGLSCVYCHDPHGSPFPVDLRYPRRDDRFCTDCHPRIADDIEAHTFHDPRSEGSRCLSCHCMWLTIENGHGVILDHTISIPSPRNTLRHGIPNACTACHEKEGAAWALRWMRQWYGDRRYRIEEVADAFAAARNAEPEGLEPMVRMVEDTDENLIYRASAAKLLARYPSPEAKEALLRGLGDRETLVRVCSILGLAGQDPGGVLPLLRGAMDRDGSLAVRKTAATCLIALGDRQSMARCRAEMLGLEQTTPTITRIYNLVGHTHYVEGDEEEARAWYDRVLAIYPWDRGAFDMLARMAVQKAAAFYDRKAYDEALEALAPLDAHPLVSPSAELWRGYAFLGRNDLPAAEEAFARGARARPDDVHLQRGLGSVLRALGRWAELREAADACLRLDPDWLPALLWRAEARYALGDAAGAAGDARELLRRAPGHRAAGDLLARILGR